MPPPLHPISVLGNSLLSTLGGEVRTKPAPPGSHRLIADFDPPFMENIFDLPQRQWIADIHHQSQADDLGEVLK